MITATATVGGLPAFAAVERDWAQPISCDQILPGTLTNTSGASFQMGYADYYSFSGSSNETVAVTMNSENFNPYLLVLDTNCNGLMDSSGSTNGTNSQITCTLPATGSYIIEASSLLSYQTGSYSLIDQVATELFLAQHPQNVVRLVRETMLVADGVGIGPPVGHVRMVGAVGTHDRAPPLHGAGSVAS